MKVVHGVYNVKTLAHVRSMLIKYAHVWNTAMTHERLPSNRMLHWFDYYNDARQDAPGVWREFCTQIQRAPDHDAGDLMA